MEYIINSESFNKLRYEYEQKIVNFQIDWMLNDGDNWIVDPKFGGDLYMFNSKSDYAFRKGVVDTLLAIGMNIDAIEEGIEKNTNKWRERYMKVAFNNIYSKNRYSISSTDTQRLEEPSQEHYENWRKMRLYEYYVKHKNSVEKYGQILPETQMTELEVIELHIWLKKAHDERMKKIEEYDAEKELLSAINLQEIYSGVGETAKQSEKTNKPKSLIKKYLKNKNY